MTWRSSDPPPACSGRSHATSWHYIRKRLSAGCVPASFPFSTSRRNVCQLVCSYISRYVVSCTTNSQCLVSSIFHLPSSIFYLLFQRGERIGVGRMRDLICAIFLFNQSHCSMYQRDVDRYLHQSLDALSMCHCGFCLHAGGLFFSPFILFCVGDFYAGC